MALRIDFTYFPSISFLYSCWHHCHDSGVYMHSHWCSLMMITLELSSFLAIKGLFFFLKVFLTLYQIWFINIFNFYELTIQLILFPHTMTIVFLAINKQLVLPWTSSLKVEVDPLEIEPVWYSLTLLEFWSLPKDTTKVMLQSTVFVESANKREFTFLQQPEICWIFSLLKRLKQTIGKIMINTWQ